MYIYIYHIYYTTTLRINTDKWWNIFHKKNIARLIQQLSQNRHVTSLDKCGSNMLYWNLLSEILLTSWNILIQMWWRALEELSFRQKADWQITDYNVINHWRDRTETLHSDMVNVCLQYKSTSTKSNAVSHTMQYTNDISCWERYGPHSANNRSF